ncbi:MAG: DUF4956 domain-containing protein [Bacillota bacterium]
MINEYLNSLFNLVENDFKLLIINNIVAIILSLYIIFIYKISYKGQSYNKNFSSSIALITIITSLVMHVISNNIALSLGMVGALSIIRFRTAIKDIADATFIFWAIAIGIACAVSQFMAAIIGSIAGSIILLLTNSINSSNNYLIILRTTKDYKNTAENIVKDYFSNNAHLKVDSINEETGNLIFEVNNKILSKANKKNNQTIFERLEGHKEILSIEKVENSLDISR